nr:hypothetical protein [Tanacetum cinerariifolium]
MARNYTMTKPIARPYGYPVCVIRANAKFISTFGYNIARFANCNARSGPEPPSPDMVDAVLLSEGGFLLGK